MNPLAMIVFWKWKRVVGDKPLPGLPPWMVQWIPVEWREKLERKMNREWQRLKKRVPQ
jgi:hypothetical protein